MLGVSCSFFRIIQQISCQICLKKMQTNSSIIFLNWAYFHLQLYKFTYLYNHSFFRQQLAIANLLIFHLTYQWPQQLLAAQINHSKVFYYVVCFGGLQTDSNTHKVYIFYSVYIIMHFFFRQIKAHILVQLIYSLTNFRNITNTIH